MEPRRTLPALALGQALWLALAASSHAQDPSDSALAVERGRGIYATGRSPRALSLEARIVGGERVPALAFPCIQCHLPDGSGAAEGGRIVPPITREALARPRARRDGAELARPGYDALGLARAIEQGLDPDGRELDLAMPRYALDPRDLADLLAYLDVLGDEPAPGCDAERVRVGTLLPLSGARAGRGRALVRVLESAFATWNAAGGIHGRRLELVAADAGSTLAEAQAAARALLEEAGGVLCLVAPSELGTHPALLAELDARGVPVVGPLCVAPDKPEPGGIFWLLASLADQGRAVAGSVAASGAPHGVAWIGDGSEGAQCMADALSGELSALGIEPLAGDLAELAARRPDWLVCFGERSWVERSLAELSSSAWRPRLVLASVLLAGAPRADGFAFDLVAPAVGPGWSAGEERFEALRARLATELQDGDQDLAAWRAAYAAAELLVQGLRASGREPSRARLCAELARVRRLETGALPPLTFGPALRTGTRASLIVSHDERGALVSVQLVEPAQAAERRLEAVR